MEQKYENPAIDTEKFRNKNNSRRPPSFNFNEVDIVPNITCRNYESVRINSIIWCMWEEINGTQQLEKCNFNCIAQKNMQPSNLSTY